MRKAERRPVTCYRCGRVLGYVDISIDREGMARFRQKAEEMKRKHRCGEDPVLALERKGEGDGPDSGGGR